MKPLRASMLTASLQRALGVGNQEVCRNEEHPSLSLRNLLRGGKILVVDDNNANLRVATGALKKYGVMWSVQTVGKVQSHCLNLPITLMHAIMPWKMENPMQIASAAAQMILLSNS